jgi:hypothetical protein
MSGAKSKSFASQGRAHAEICRPLLPKLSGETDLQIILNFTVEL